MTLGEIIDSPGSYGDAAVECLRAADTATMGVLAAEFLQAAQVFALLEVAQALVEPGEGRSITEIVQAASIMRGRGE